MRRIRRHSVDDQNAALHHSICVINSTMTGFYFRTCEEAMDHGIRVYRMITDVLTFMIGEGYASKMAHEQGLTYVPSNESDS